MDVSKAFRLVSLLPKRPLEFWDRVGTAWASRAEPLLVSRPNYAVSSWAEILAGLGKALALETNMSTWEPEATQIECQLRRNLQHLPFDAPFRRVLNADFRLGRLCYLACRAMRAETIVETGVAYGVSSAFILAALEANDRGRLHSIDMPPLGQNADRWVGALVPDQLRARWELHRGTSKRLLPELLRKLGRVDLFVHDSLHTYWNMKMELDLVSQNLSERAIVICDDVQGNRAFAEWVSRVAPAFWAVAEEQEKQSLFGTGVVIREGTAST